MPPYGSTFPGALRALLACLCCGLLALPATAGAAPVSRAEAQRAALSALRARQGSAPLIVFRGSAPLKPGTRVGVAGLERLPPQAGASAGRSRDDLLRAAGVSIVRAPLAARVGREPAWFFYADEGPFQAYQHPGRVVLVGQRSGRVTVTRRFSWPPLLDGRLPYFLRSYAGYRNPRVRAFERLWRPVRPQAKAGPAVADALGPIAPGALAASPAAVTGAAAASPAPTDAERQAAAQLAAERSCAIRVGDTLGNFFDASSFDRTRAEVGALFNRLGRLDPGFLSLRYRVASGTTLRRYVERLISARGCRDVFLYVAGGGYVRGGEPAIVVGVQGRRDGRLEQHVVTASTLRAIVAANPGATFKLLLDAPGSGGFLRALGDVPNLLLFLASARSGEGSFTALPGLVSLDGSQLGNGYNGDGLLEFSNRGLRGLRCFLSDGEEVAAATAAKASGQTRSFLAWMLRRAYSLCGEGSLLALIPDVPAPVLRTPGTTVVPPSEVPRTPVTPPGPKNAAPAAAPVSVTTAEDTPVDVTLAGSDPDGDPLTYAVAAPAPGGTVSGDGVARTFAPAPDFAGTATFGYTVSDGRGGSATATVTVTVTPVDDPPVLDAGAGTTQFVEDEPPVAVAPALTVADVDDDRLAGATVTIAAGYERGADRLLFAGQHGIAGSWDAAAGELTLSGDAALADYQAALRSIAFDNPGQSPSQAPRTVRFAVRNAAASAPVERALTVTDVNERPQLGGGDAAVAFTEGDAAPVAIAPALIVSDADDAQLASATVALGAGFRAGEDELTFADQNGITGAWNATTGVLRLTGAASPAAYETALRSVGYRDARDDDPTAGDRAISLRVSDGTDDSDPAGATVTVIAVNDPPVLGGGGGTAAFSEDGPAVAVAPALTVGDVDSPRLASATVAITDGFHGGEDELTFTAQNGITGAWNATTGVLRLSGAATPAEYQAALRSVGYDNGSDDPVTAARTVTLRADDGEATSAAVTASVTVAAVNDVPRLSTGGGSPTYAEGDATGVIVDPGVTVADPDDATLASATVTISSGFDAGADELRFTDGGGIAGSWNGTTGVLTLTGPATPAAFQAALRTVRFRSTSTNPAAGARTISFTAADAAGNGPAVTTAVAFDLVDDPPALTASVGVTAWAGSDLAVDAGLTVADPDSAQLTGATVAITSGYVPAEDSLRFTDQNGISGAWSALSGTLTLSGAASLADYQAALRTVVYARTAPFLDDTTRTISFTVSNARSSNTATKQVAFADPPQLSSPGAGLAYTENDAASAIDPAIAVSDPDSTELTGASAEITAGYAAGEDLLSATTAGTAITATVSGGRLELAGEDTVAHYQQVLRTIAYRNGSEDPSTAPRTVTFTVTDGLYAATATNTVTVTAVNDAPLVTTSGGTSAYVEDDATGMLVDPAVTVSDPDDATLAGATVQITGSLAAAEDRLTFTAAHGITGSYASASGRLTLSGSATPAQYQEVLRSVRYLDAETVAPSTATRTISFSATDATATGAVATKDVSVRAVNDAPQIVSGATLAYTENDAPTAIDPALSLTDGDSARLAGASVRLGAGHAPGEDVLAFVDQNGITGSFDRANGRLTLSGSATVADYRAALRSVTYANSSEDPSETPRTVTFTADDGAAVDSSASATATITVAKVNDAPVAPSVSASAVGNTPLFSGTTAPAGRPARVAAGPDASVLASATDVDGPGPLRVDVAASDATGDRGGAVSWNADGTFTYRPAAGFLGTETIGFVVTDQGTPTATTRSSLQIAVQGRAVYVDNAAAAGGDGRAETPFDTLAEADAAADRRDDTIYLFRGDGTATGLAGGISLLDGQRLLGESEPLSVGSEDLYPGRAGARSQLAGGVTLASGNTVAGLGIASGAAAAALDGGTGDRDGTLRDLVVTTAAGAGLRLQSTSGTWSIRDVAISASGGHGISLASAGTVAFSGTDTVDASNGSGLRATDTTTSGTIASVRVRATAPATDGIVLARESGSLRLTSVDLDTTGTGLSVDSSEGIDVGSAGGSAIVAGGPAVAVSASSRAPAVAPRIQLQNATSTGGTAGISLDGLGAGTFSAVGGALSGHSAAELAVNGGSGAVTYGGTIGDGSGLSAQIRGRTGGAVTVSGSVNDSGDAGGGIDLSANSGGSTTFSGAAKTLSTGAQPAVSLAATGAHAVTFSGGGLDVDTTTGAGFAATGSAAATVTVSGAGNTIDSAAGGTALRVAGPAIGSGHLTFQRIAQSGGTNAIVLNGTGASGGLRVTGAPAGSPAASSGGLLDAQSGDAISLTSTSDVALAAIRVSNAVGNGIAGSGVAGLALTGSSAITGSGTDAAPASGISLTGLTGTVALTGANVSDSAYRNVDLVGAGSLDATISGGTYSGTATGSAASGDDAIHFEAAGGAPRLTIDGATFSGNRGDHVQIASGTSSTATATVAVRNTTMTNTVGSSGGGIVLNPGGTGTWNATIAGNTITGARIEAITVDTPGSSSDPQPVTLNATVTGNTIGSPAVIGSGASAGNGVGVRSNGAATVRALLSGNLVRRYASAGIALVQNDGNGTLDATLSANTLGSPDASGAPVDGVRVLAGGAGTGDAGTLCADIGRPAANSLAGSSALGGSDLFARQRDGTTIRLPGYAGIARDNTAVAAFLAAANNGNGVPTASASAAATGGGFLGGASCAQP